MDDLEKVFLESPGDVFAICQLKQIPETRSLRFASMSQALMIGKKIDRENYTLLYVGDLTGHAGKPREETLEEIYTRFNLRKPEDFSGHSLSMSDIVGLKQNGAVSFHYVDTFGFREVKNFLPGNPLRGAENSMEDDYGMIDGMVGNNGRNPALEEKKPAVGNPESWLPLQEQLRQVIRDHTERPPRTSETRKPGIQR